MGAVQLRHLAFFELAPCKLRDPAGQFCLAHVGMEGGRVPAAL